MNGYALVCGIDVTMTDGWLDGWLVGWLEMCGVEWWNGLDWNFFLLGIRKFSRGIFSIFFSSLIEDFFLGLESLEEEFFIYYYITCNFLGV
jgi:hypothetical protein